MTAAAVSRWTYIAAEGQSFAVTGTQTVRFGTAESWTERVVTDGGSCTNEFFGSDPAFGFGKECDVQASAPDTPAGWTAIAVEGQSFAVNGTQTVRFGTAESWVQRVVTGGGWCTNEFFGSDPAFGFGKQCDVQASAPDTSAGWTTIAIEGQSFTVNGTQTIRFGTAGNWIQRIVTGGGWCTNEFFGSDPASGFGKECDVQALAPDTPAVWTAIAVEGQSFAVNGTQTIRFGRAGSWIQRIVTGGGWCTNEFFGSDPAVGFGKECAVQAPSAVIAPTPPSPDSYSTTFDLNENPLSEGGKWLHTDSTLTVCKTVGGRAFGTQSGNGSYDDSNAYLTGYGNDHEVEGTVWLDPALSGSGHREVEILLRWTDTGPLRSTAYGPTRANGYEINVNHAGNYMQLGRFKGALLTQVDNFAVPKTGDRFRARIEGQRIRVWWNDVLKIDFTDTDAMLQITSGNPGIGFFVDGGSPNTDFGFDAISIRSL